MVSSVVEKCGQQASIRAAAPLDDDPEDSPDRPQVHDLYR
jgi:hypothetical protein